MVRTRDFILVASIVMFVALFATTSIVRMVWQGNSVPSEAVMFNLDENGDRYEGIPVASEPIDRQAIRDRLRALIADRDEEYIASSDTAASVEDVVEDFSDETYVVQTCPQPDDTIGVVATWPLRDVRLTVLEGARVVLYEPSPTPPPVDIGSTTQPVSIPVQTIAQLPLTPEKNESQHCVPSTVVGVTTTGWPLFNNSVAAYAASGPETLIGYARDGFAVYGYYEGEVDECGGYDHPSGYRYSLQRDRSYMIGCFQGTPQPIYLQ